MTDTKAKSASKKGASGESMGADDVKDVHYTNRMNPETGKFEVLKVTRTQGDQHKTEVESSWDTSREANDHIRNDLEESSTEEIQPRPDIA